MVVFNEWHTKIIQITVTVKIWVQVKTVLTNHFHTRSPVQKEISLADMCWIRIYHDSWHTIVAFSLLLLKFSTHWQLVILIILILWWKCGYKKKCCVTNESLVNTKLLVQPRQSERRIGTEWVHNPIASDVASEIDFFFRSCSGVARP